VCFLILTQDGAAGKLYGKLVRHGGGHFDACRKEVLVKEY